MKKMCETSIDYLRISVTDRCNLRCIYCDPLQDCEFMPRKEILTFEEIHRIVELFAQCGITKIRLTGGEPLIRTNIVQLVRQLAPIRGIDELTLTTNGVLLESMAAELKAAGLKRVNVSLDTTSRGNYKQITGFDLFEKVMKGIYKALEVGLKPVKMNSVIIQGVNVSQVPALARMSVELPVAARFIEYCPTGRNTRPASSYVPNSEVRRIIEHKFGPLTSTLSARGNGPAMYFKIADSAGCIGFISGASGFFCRSCNRLRLTSDGNVRPCLYSAHSYDLKGLIRGGANDRQVLDLLKRIIAEKKNFTKLNSFTEDFCMRSVGG
ncbi:MAG: GTP 3',8-cyclase MoaA [Planctomycetota bacterium]|nr:MAG: GTP 3',8-cyclase MoaA [Planctomycetota bacterium]